MKLQRYGRLAGVALAGTLTLTACGTDNNSTPTSSAAGGGASAAKVDCADGSLTIQGSTAQAPAMSTWIKNYNEQCPNAKISYTPNGSGAGVTAFGQGTSDFAGSDFPLNATQQPKADARCKQGPAINLPLVPGPIALAYNVPGASKLSLSSATLASIFTGKIVKWNDPAIAKDNPGVTLPGLGIQTFHRSDSSGTTFNFTNYLANEAKADWPTPADKDWKAPGGQGVKGSAGVAQGVKSTPGAIGYMEQSYATQSNLSFAKLSNAAGTFVELTQQNAINFIAKSKVTGTGDDLKLSFDYPDTSADAYPNVLVTYEIACSKGNDAAKLKLIKSFLGYAASDAGQATLPSQGYLKLPANIQAKVQAAVNDLS